MVFECHGCSYDTAQLRQFETGDRWIPFVYLTPDGKTAFFAALDKAERMQIHLATNGDIRRLASRYKIDAIRQAQRYPAFKPQTCRRAESDMPA
jgi:hypothetical protein